jgi:hypothetical protein
MAKLESPSDYILRVRGGPDYENSATMEVNDENEPLFINSPEFTGYLLMRILDFEGVNREMDKKKDGLRHAPLQNPASNYFVDRKRSYSMVIQGRYFFYSKIIKILY